MKKQVEWILSNGKRATYIIRLELEKVTDADGYKIKVPCYDIYEHIEVEGMGTMGCAVDKLDEPREINGKRIVAKSGKIGITDNVYDEIIKAQAEIKSHHAWVAKRERIERNQRLIAEIEQRERANGLCPRCGTYCYGDCQSN